MAHSHDAICPECGAVVYIRVVPMGVPGGKTTEEVECPICNTHLYKAMTDGWFDVIVKSGPTNPKYTKLYDLLLRRQK